MEVNPSWVPHKWRHPHLWGERVEWSSVFAEKSCRCSASHNFTCFSQGQHSKDIQLQDSFFFSEETSCLAVIFRAIFSDGALKTWGTFLPSPGSSTGLLCNSPISLVVLTLFSPGYSVNWTLAGAKQQRETGSCNEKAAALALTDQGLLQLLPGVWP